MICQELLLECYFLYCVRITMYKRYIFVFRSWT